MDDRAKSHIEEKVSMGGVEFSYSKRRNYHRCDLVCGGFTGLHPSGKWSTWSPARFPIPDKDEDFMEAMIECLEPFSNRPPVEGGEFHHMLDNKIILTCGNCQLLCHPDRDERKRRYKLITQNGVVIQEEDGSLRAVSPQEARKHLDAMPPEKRALYERVG